MTAAVTRSPWLRGSEADLAADAAFSPFRSESDRTRAKAAQAMIVLREQEIRDLRLALSRGGLTAAQRSLTNTRLRASLNNLAAWQSYAVECEREPRAVIVPPRRKRRTTRS